MRGIMTGNKKWFGLGLLLLLAYGKNDRAENSGTAQTKGGGESRANYFYRDSEIILQFYQIQMFPLSGLGWEGEVETEELKCEMVFSK